VSKVGGEPRGCCARPKIPWHSGLCGEKALPTRISFRINIARHVPNDKLSSSAISMIVKRRFPWITALTRSTVLLVGAVDGQPVCGSSSMDVRPFLNREYHSNVLDQLNAVSLNAYCSISYVSVAILPSFWQNLMQTRCSFNTSISQYNRGTNTIALQINSLMTESSRHPLLWYVASGDVVKYPTWLSLRYC
jgi:hypothetical protein